MTALIPSSCSASIWRQLSCARTAPLAVAAHHARPASSRCFGQLAQRPAPSPIKTASILAQLRPGITALPSPRMLSTSTVSGMRSSLAAPRPASDPTPKPTPTPTSPSPPPSPPAGQPLSEDIATLPNLLTISRLALTPYIGYLVCTSQFAPACAYLFLAGLSDLADGWLARRTGRYTVFGSIADPAADKALMTTMVVSLAWCGMMPLWLATLILGRDVALVASAFVIRYRTLAPPKTLKRYFNPKLPSATVIPTAISKYNTFLQLLLVGLLTILPVVFPSANPASNQQQQQQQGDAAQPAATSSTPSPSPSSSLQSWKPAVDTAVNGFMIVVAATTVWSGLGYLGGGGSAKVLSQKVAQNIKKASGGAAGSRGPKL